MINLLKNQKRRIKPLNLRTLSGVIISFVKSLEKELISLNKGQLLGGKNAEGNSLFNKESNRDSYSYLTEQLSNGVKQEGEHYTLKDSGDFFKGFVIERTDNRLLFYSRNFKTELLIENFEELFGLSDENLERIITSKVKPFLINHIKREIGI